MTEGGIGGQNPFKPSQLRPRIVDECKPIATEKSLYGIVAPVRWTSASLLIEFLPIFGHDQRHKNSNLLAKTT